MTRPKPKLIMIRPLEQAKEFVANFANTLGKDIDAQFIPLVQIKSVAFSVPKDDIYIFTSINALHIFCGSTPHRANAICVGANLGQMARGLGFNVLDMPETAQDLAPILPLKSTYIRGFQISLDLVGLAKSYGKTMQEVIVYEQQDVDVTPAQVQAFHTPCVIPVFSQNSARRLIAVMDGVADEVTIIAISQKVAEPLQDAGFKDVIVLAHPTRDEMMKELAKYVC